MKANLSPRGAAMQSPPLARRVLAWWDRHRRSLPWRAEPGVIADPYRVWLSEILLQQTTVQAVIPYFERFRALWPRVEDLAAAPLEEVMRAFAGLGYYSRARNMHACAREIARRGGVFPRGEAELRALPGVGAYTAAAVAAIAFNEPAAPVDGNIARIMTRLHAIEQPIAKARGAIAKAAAALTPPDRPGDFAQALMDIGAAICTPRNPDCPACPMRSSCAAFATGEPQAYPRKAIRKARPHRKGAAFFAQAADGAILLRTRPPRGLLGGTLELPGTPWSADYAADEAASGAPFPALWRLTPGLVEQVFTHFSLALNVYCTRLAGIPPAHEGCFWVAEEEIEGAALSSLMRKAVAHGLNFASEKRTSPPKKRLNKRRNAPSTKTRSAQ
ncbi:A/G-specific adenine glycosylase [Methylocapsa sp. S129]|uniref:A/G-specific adenine glycosylase n=1 Tax=Methylocapsa sp. S129 TaxID=1641869 RepID=UPI001FEE56A0|nr:A/G-specific adenine glycosylase [Methylocapsa sp. S129]